MVHQYITKKQQELILLLYRFRFLNRVQFQTLLNHKKFNRIIVWLNDLAEKGYLAKVKDDSKIKMSPTIYYIEKKGIQFLNSQEQCEKKYIARMYKEWKKSKAYVDRCLFINDLYINFIKKYGHTPHFAFYTQSDYSISSIIKKIFPQFVYRKGKNYYIGEFIKEKPRRAVRGRIDRYLSFYSKEEGKRYAKTSKFLFICPNEEIEDYTIKYLKKSLLNESIDNLKFNISTFDQVKRNGIEGKIWNSTLEE